ncbi:mandelate racemase/muconate lactonizing enzyme family protein [Mesorhizobium sp. AR07]|uniref:mandelate racemase/muconate lactonizing enzyme family protein n=1 Tax=Mesorhizobium sp. AR07 TaxID=2865838 RepID=UPI00215E6C2A|nr:mandelate racemase/muconate lactonizing enzyme family protein [Mesorhizobium sp. AR07]UVK43882.1 mandelate racemase/muconate lactonizing enzyme family protein [Mesorhizobium sp. AR07]
MTSKIARLEVIPVVSSVVSAGDLDGTTDTVIIKIHDEDGRYGFGEADAPPSVVKSFLEMPTAHLWSRNAGEILIGEDPIEIAAIWQKLYDGTFWPGRRGIGIHAISAIDIALHDLAGKQFGVPAYKLMGGARREKLRPYCTIFPGLAQGRGIRDLMREIGRQFDAALQAGFRAVKMEVLFYDLVTDRELAGLIGEGRRMLGDDILMAVDFGYRWHNWHDALFVLDRISDCDIFFAEATLQHDDLAGHARLAERSSIRIGGAEAAATRFEIREWLTVAGVGVVQPNIGRGGGLTEMRRIADMCELHGAEVVPHGWKTGITSAAGRHFQAACQASPVFEYVSPHVFDSVLRRELVSPEPAVVDGLMELPTGPGLGIELNEELVSRWRTDGK